MGSNCTKVGARAYTLQSVSDHYVVSNYHPFKVKYDFDSACRGTITQLWSYDGCFERSRFECQGQSEYVDTLYPNDNCTWGWPDCTTNEFRRAMCGMEVDLFAPPEERRFPVSSTCHQPLTSNVHNAQMQSTSQFYRNDADYTNLADAMSFHDDFASSHRDFQCEVLGCGQGLSHFECPEAYTSPPKHPTWLLKSHLKPCNITGYHSIGYSGSLQQYLWNLVQAHCDELRGTCGALTEVHWRDGSTGSYVALLPGAYGSGGFLNTSKIKRLLEILPDVSTAYTHSNATATRVLTTDVSVVLTSAQSNLRGWCMVPIPAPETIRSFLVNLNAGKPCQLEDSAGVKLAMLSHSGPLQLPYHPWSNWLSGAIATCKKLGQSVCAGLSEVKWPDGGISSYAYLAEGAFFGNGSFVAASDGHPVIKPLLQTYSDPQGVAVNTSLGISLPLALMQKAFANLPNDPTPVANGHQLHTEELQKLEGYCWAWRSAS